MRVRAKTMQDGEAMNGVGYYDLRLFKGGEEFELSDPKLFSGRWMEKVEDAPLPVQFVEVEVEKESKKKR